MAATPSTNWAPPLSNEKRELSAKRRSNVDLYKLGTNIKPNSSLRQGLISPVQLKSSPVKKSVIFQANEESQSEIESIKYQVAVSPRNNSISGNRTPKSVYIELLH